MFLITGVIISKVKEAWDQTLPTIFNVEVLDLSTDLLLYISLNELLAMGL